MFGDRRDTLLRPLLPTPYSLLATAYSRRAFRPPVRCYNPRAMSRADATALARADREVDVSGLSCPLPILRTRKALNDMASGQTIRVPSTGVRDIQAFSRQTGNGRDGAFRFVLKRR